MTPNPAAPPQPLEGRVALVTGASSGIGAATALRLARGGARIALAARRTERLTTLSQEILELTGNEALVLTTDVTDQGSATAAIDQTMTQLAGLDILVNNAGVMLPALVADADPSDWRTMIEVNLLGVMYTTRAALPHLTAAAHRRGMADLVIVSSVAARVARPNNAVYNATKFGINAFAEALRQEIAADGVRVAVVEPGMVDTELTTHMSPEAAQRIQSGQHDTTPLQPDDIAEAIHYAVTRPAHVAVNEQLIRPARSQR